MNNQTRSQERVFLCPLGCVAGRRHCSNAAIRNGMINGKRALPVHRAILAPRIAELFVNHTISRPASQRLYNAFQPVSITISGRMKLRQYALVMGIAFSYLLCNNDSTTAQAIKASGSATGELTPNELGKIPILTYHKIADENTEYTRSRESYANDLVLLKKHGFYPVSLSELRTGKLTTPKGKIPVLITYDDSSETHFKYEKNGSLSPGCAVEIMERFQKKNADFPLRGVFFVLPKAAYPNNFFGQTELIGKKLKYLTDKGFEIGSHTLWHANLKKYRDKIEEQLALGTFEIQKYLKNYPVYAFALPYGIFPPKNDEPRLRSGTYRGHKYKHEMVFDYSNGLSHSIYDTKFDTYHIRRLHGNEKSLAKLFKQATTQKHIFFVSDGDPNIVTVEKSEAERVRLRPGQRLVTN